MPSPYALKDQTILETPILLFDCTLSSGEVQRWSTHQVTFDGHDYAARVLAHNAFDMRASGDDGIEAVSRVAVTLANADSYVSQLERNGGIKGSRIHVRFVFFNLKTGAAASDPVTLFRGSANPPDELSEATARISFMNRLSPQRMLMPNVRIQRRCPWVFPTTAGEREEALNGLDRGKHSPFFRCGYSPDRLDGVGNLDGSGQPFANCDYSRGSCEQRGMFSKDSANRQTGRFGGLGFVPASVLVRGTGDSGYKVSDPVENEARYNDFVPMAYGTAWYEPPIAFARNDGNLTRMQVLLGLGDIQGVTKVIVNDVEIPLAQNGVSMTGTGWYAPVNLGNRTGNLDLNFATGNGEPLGDPYGSMAYLAVVVPNRVSDGRRLPRVKVLLDGLRVSRFNADGGYRDEAFTNNPAWVLLDLLNRAGWQNSEIDLGSFSAAADHCDGLIDSHDLHGNAIRIARFQANLVLRRRRSLAEILRGVRNAAGLHLGYGPAGQLQLKLESKIAITQSTKPLGSNSTAALFGGWPVYEFGDGKNGTTGLLRRENGQPAIRFWSRPTSDSPNRFSAEFQDAFNEYQQDSLSLVDAEDARRVGQEIAGTYNVIGLANFDQAARVLRLQLDKSLRGNMYVELETSVRALGVRPGDLIALTYAKEGLDRQLFRVTQVSPRESYATAVITAQIHQEDWYLQGADVAFGGSRETNAGLGLPRPLIGTSLDSDGLPVFGVEETAGESSSRLRVAFTPPARPVNSAASIPVVGLTPQIETTGGTLRGGQSLYYAVSAVDAEGQESRLSFLMRATIPQGANTNLVRLNGLSFSAATVSFKVYRGPNPQQLFRVAGAVTVAATFEDAGLVAQLVAPPDANYHEARFYWRFETQPEVIADLFAANQIGRAGLTMPVDAYKGMVVRITRGRGAGQERIIEANNAERVSVSPPWDVQPDSTSRFVIATGAWSFGSSGPVSPVEFDVPAYRGNTIQITGRAANVNGQEASPELSPITRFQLGGSASGGDDDAPPQPAFALDILGDGSVNLTAIGFPALTNTRTISAGTLNLYAWSELQTTAPPELTLALDATSTDFQFSPGLPVVDSAAIGSFVQVGEEILRVTGLNPSGLAYTVERGAYGSATVEHSLGAKVYHLRRETYVLPFVRDFFGSPAAASFNYPVYTPDVRIGAADFFVTNAFGASPVDEASFGRTIDQGLRTLSGGQLTLQFDGPLAIGSNLTPPLVVERQQAIRDVQAVVNEAPTGANVVVRVLRDGGSYAELTILAGFAASAPVSGFGRIPLEAGDLITLELVDVPPSSAGTPGRDLTVILRR